MGIYRYNIIEIKKIVCIYNTIVAYRESEEYRVILFYAWTNLTLINMLNTKNAYYRDVEADIIIRFNLTMSQQLISSIRDEKVFRHIYFIDNPRFVRKIGLWGKIPKLRMIVSKKNLRNYYKRFVINTLGETLYDKLIVAGLWDGAIYLLNELYKKNRNIRLEYVEEGERSYDGIKALMQVLPAGKMREKALQKYYAGLIKSKLRKNLTNIIYLYAPERYQDANITTLKIPAIDNKNSICKKVLRDSVSTMEYSHYLYYEKRRVYFFANYLALPYEENYDQAYKIIESIIKIIGKNQLIIKTHTNVTKHRLEFAKKYEKEAFVDREVFLFEGLYTEIDIESKILNPEKCSAL